MSLPSKGKERNTLEPLPFYFLKADISILFLEFYKLRPAKVLSCNSVGLNEMVPVAVGGGVGGDNRWAGGPRNVFRSVGFGGSNGCGYASPVCWTGRNMRPRFLNDCTCTDVANCVEVSHTLKTQTSSVAPKGTSSDMRGTSSSCRKRKPQPQLDSYGFQMQRESYARNVRTRCSTDCTDTTASGCSISHIKLLLMGSLSTKEAASSTPFFLALPVMTIGIHMYRKGLHLSDSHYRYTCSNANVGQRTEISQRQRQSPSTTTTSPTVL
ncbi:hypothetical protein Tco_0267952 [Tanacetum coccineum]